MDMFIAALFVMMENQKSLNIISGEDAKQTMVESYNGYTTKII